MSKRRKKKHWTSDAFLTSYEWRALRMRVLKKYGARCQCCGARPRDGIRVNVDHIKPRRRYPGLALTESNLQVLCEACNHGKGNWDQTDWRGETPVKATVPRMRLVRPERDEMTAEQACRIWSKYGT